MPVAAARHPRTPGGYAARHAEAMESAKVRARQQLAAAGGADRPAVVGNRRRPGAAHAARAEAVPPSAARRGALDARRRAAEQRRAAEAMAAAEEASAARRERERAALAAGIAACESRLSAEAMLGGASTVASEVVGAAGGVGAAEAVVGTLRAAEVAAAAEAGMSGWDAAVMSSWDAGDATDGEPSDVSLTADEATDDDASDGGADDAATASDDEHGRHTRRATPSPPHLEVGWRVLDGAEGEGGDVEHGDDYGDDDDELQISLSEVSLDTTLPFRSPLADEIAHEGCARMPQLEVVCPEGAGEGMVIDLNLGDGGVVQVQVPAGVGPGMPFNVELAIPEPPELAINALAQTCP